MQSYKCPLLPQTDIIYLHIEEIYQHRVIPLFIALHHLFYFIVEDEKNPTGKEIPGSPTVFLQLTGRKLPTDFIQKK